MISRDSYTFKRHRHVLLLFFSHEDQIDRMNILVTNRGRPCFYEQGGLLCPLLYRFKVRHNFSIYNLLDVFVFRVSVIWMMIPFYSRRNLNPFENILKSTLLFLRTGFFPAVFISLVLLVFSYRHVCAAVTEKADLL